MGLESVGSRIINTTKTSADFARFNLRMYRDHMSAKSLVAGTSMSETLGADWTRAETVGSSPVCQAVGIKLRDLTRAQSFVNIHMGLTKLCQALDEALDNGIANPTGRNGVSMADIKRSGAVIQVNRGNKSRETKTATFPQIQTAFINALCDSLPDVPDARKKVLRIAASYVVETIRYTNQARKFKGDIMPFGTSLELVRKVTGGLFSKAFEAFGAINNIPEEKIEIFKGAGGSAAVAMQFGDDLQDWRKDMLKHSSRQKGESSDYQRPVENLFLGLLNENPQEFAALMAHINDHVPACRRGNILITETYFLTRKYAPVTLAKFQALFEAELAKVPNFPHRGEMITQWKISFYKIVPITDDFTTTRPWLESLISKLVKRDKKV